MTQRERIDEKALKAAERAYRAHIDGRPMVHAIEAYLTHAGDAESREASGVIETHAKSSPAPSCHDCAKLRESNAQLAIRSEFALRFLQDHAALNDDDEEYQITCEKACEELREALAHAKEGI